MLLICVDMEDREWFFNVCDILCVLLDNSIVLVINENDVVVIVEIKVGDNDNFFVLVVIFVGVDKLLLLIDQSGLFIVDLCSNLQVELIKDVYGIDDVLCVIVGDSVFGFGIGGMGIKLQVVDVVCWVGIDIIIVVGNCLDVIGYVMVGLLVGICFYVQEFLLENCKCWIFGVLLVGEIIVDVGVIQVIFERGSLLLLKGIKIVSGNFFCGEVICICNSEGCDIVYGVSCYNSDVLCFIVGQYLQ